MIFNEKDAHACSSARLPAQHDRPGEADLLGFCPTDLGLGLELRLFSLFPVRVLLRC